MNVPESSRLARYLAVILRWLAVAFAVFVLTLLIGTWITHIFLPKVYTTTAQIQILPPSETNVRPISPDGSGFDSINFRAEFDIMESPDFLLKIIHDLGLDKAWAKRVFKSTQDQPSDQEALAYMRKIVKLDFARGTNIIDITVSSDVPEEAADIANAIADLYKVRRDAEQARRESEGEDAFRDQVAQQQKVVDDARTALEKMPKDQSPTLHDTQVKFERQQVLLDALNVRLQQFEANSHLLQSPVRTISRAGPARADRSFASLITTVAAGCLGVMAASFVEIILLFSRAGGRPNN